MRNSKRLHLTTVRPSSSIQIPILTIIDGDYPLPIFSTTLSLIASATSLAFVGPTLCRNPEWLSTATGYTLSASKAGEEINTYPRIFWPPVSRYLQSYRQVRAQFRTARRLLLPLIKERRLKKIGKLAEAEERKGEDVGDMLQWLIDSARGKDAETDRLVKRMLFLNMAAMHTTALTATNILLDLCARPDSLSAIREEMNEATARDGRITASTLNSLKLTDSFMRESRRLNPLGLRMLPLFSLSHYDSRDAFGNMLLMIDSDIPTPTNNPLYTLNRHSPPSQLLHLNSLLPCIPRRLHLPLPRNLHS